MAKQPRSKATPTCTTQGQLARAVGVSEKTVSLWLRDPRWPAAWRRGPWDPDAVRKWRADNLQPDPGEQRGGAAGVSDLKRGELANATNYAKLNYIVEKTIKTKVDRLIAEKQYVKREEQEQNQLKKNETVRVTLMQLGRALRQALAHKSPDEVETILNEALQKICDDGFGAGGGGAPAPPGAHDDNPDDR